MVKVPGLGRLLIGAVEYLWAFYVILNGNSVYHANVIRNLFLLENVLVLTFLLLVLNLLYYRCQPSRTSVLGAAIMMIYGIVYFCVMQNKMSATTYAELFIIGAPMTFLLFSELHRHGALLRLIRRIGDVVLVLAVISLIFWFLGEVFKVITPNGYLNIAWGNFNLVHGYYGIHYAFQVDTTFFPDAHLYRNSGIFAEAPMFNLWLDIALATELFLKPKASKLRVVILAVTVLTTLSVTGILFLVLCAALKACSNLRRMSKTKIGILFFAGAVIIPLLGGVVIKSVVLKTDTQSYLMRLSDYAAGVRTWVERPLFGAGFGNLGALQEHVVGIENASSGFSNSVTAVLGTGGLWTALLYYISHVGMIFPRFTGSKKLACFGLCMMFLFVTTIFFARFIGVLMVVFGYAIITGAKAPDLEEKTK